MSVHFTYSDTPCFKQLRQGDVLKKTPELLSVISEVHPHYQSDEYLYFQVLTQSCDLVRRTQAGCKTRYITLAAIRSLDDVIKRELDRIPEQEKFVFLNDQFISKSQKPFLHDFLSKLFNNQHKDYFFLHDEPNYGFNGKCCTLLHLSIAIRSREHYDACLNSKILELDENFQSKLGWMVGNIYSRVGTKDFIEEKKLDTEGMTKHLDNVLDDYVLWVPKKQIKHYKKIINKIRENKSIENITEEVTQKIDNLVDEKVKSIVAAAVRSLDLNDEDEIRNTKRKINTALRNDPGLTWLTELIKDDIVGK